MLKWFKERETWFSLGGIRTACLNILTIEIVVQENYKYLSFLSLVPNWLNIETLWRPFLVHAHSSNLLVFCNFPSVRWRTVNIQCYFLKYLHFLPRKSEEWKMDFQNLHLCCSPCYGLWHINLPLWILLSCCMPLFQCFYHDLRLKILFFLIR